MTLLEYQEVVDLVYQLDRDFEATRAQARGRYDLYSLRKDPYVPDEIAREGKLRVNSAHIIAAAQTIRADLMMNPTEFTVIPLARERDGAIPRDFSNAAETVERAAAVIWGRMNEGRRIDREIIWHQLVSPYGIMILEFNDFEMPEQPEWMKDDVYTQIVDKYEKEWLPWSVYLPDPLTCSWVERDGRPIMFARKYRLTVREIQDSFSKKPGTTNPDKKLCLIEDRWEWKSDDYRTEDGSNSKSGFREVDMLWLDDGENIYLATLDPDVDGRTSGHGQLLWSRPNPIGRVTAFVVAGNTTPMRKPEDRYEPFLWPLMQTVDSMNSIRSTRATAARNLAGPHTYISLDPELVKLYLNRGEKLPTEARWRKNETKYLLGKVEQLPSELSQDWDKIELAINEELQRFLPSQFVNVVDPAVLKAATATSILHAAEAGLRMYGPLMVNYDSAIRDMFECMLLSLITYYDDQDIYSYSTGDELTRGKSLKPGMLYKLNAKLVNFPHKLSVKTRGMSQAQAAAQYDLVLRQWVLPDGTKGPATLDDLIDAANYTDPIAQKMKLAQEAIMGVIDPWLEQMAVQAARDAIFEDSGIDLPIGNQQMMASGGGLGGASAGAGPGGVPGGPPPNAGGGGGTDVARIPAAQNQTMNAPMVLGPEGGSAPSVGGPTG